MTDYTLEDTVFTPFTTRAFATGIPTALVSGQVDVYEDATATPIVTSETFVASLNSVVGLNMITTTATSASGFNVGGKYTLVLAAGTVGGVSVIGEVVGEFTIDHSAAAQDLANATDGLTALKTGIDAIPLTAMRGTDNAALASALTTAQNDLDLITGTDGATLATTQGNYAPSKAGDNMGTVSSVTGNVDGSVGSVTLLAANAVAVGSIATDAITAGALAAGAVTEIAQAILPPTNTALTDVTMLMVLSSDHATPATGLTPVLTVSIDGGTFSAKDGSTTVAEVATASGVYQLDLASADTNGTIITYKLAVATADDSFLTIRFA